MNYFGTNGIQGIFGSTINSGTAFLLGNSLSLVGGDCPIVVVASDTRPSSKELMQGLVCGIYQGGGNVINLGILPTNAVGHFVRKFGGDYGVMVTAPTSEISHNGCVVFDRYGVELCHSKQVEISKKMHLLATEIPPKSKVFEPRFYDIDNIYAEDLVRLVKCKFHGKKVVLHCGNGAGAKVAQKAFALAGAQVVPFAVKPHNATENYLQNNDFLQATVGSIGFALDVNCQSVQVVENGTPLSQNKVLFAIAKYLLQQGNLPNNRLCAGHFVNNGLCRSLNKIGIKVCKCKHGLGNLFMMMVKHGLTFGGQMGCYVFGNHATYSDGILSALVLAQISQQVGSIANYAKGCVESPSTFQTIASEPKFCRDDKLQALQKRIAVAFPNCKVVLYNNSPSTVSAYTEGQNNLEAMQMVVATLSQPNV